MTDPAPAEFDQLAAAYRRMAAAGHQPLAGSASWAEEIQDFVTGWLAEMDMAQFDVPGSPEPAAASTLVFVTEAARLVCTTKYAPALELLRLAVRELEALATAPPTEPAPAALDRPAAGCEHGPLRCLPCYRAAQR